jgi:presenilin-like A22 family membrane protease
VIAILVATAVMLLAFKYGVDSFVRLLIVGASAWLSLYLFRLVVPDAFAVGGVNLGAIALAIGLGAALYVYPEWYVVDAAGAIMGAVAAGLFGIAFGILPALVLLVVLAVYDAISVYRTEHMLTLASGVLELRVPVVLVVPTTAGYSFLDAEFGEDEKPQLATDDADGGSESNPGAEADVTDATTDIDTGATTTSNGEDGADGRNASQGSEDGDGGEDGEPPEPLERDALFIGLGDAVIPSVLVASAAFFVPEGVPTLASIPLPAVTAMGGTLAGLAVLLWMVLKGRAHAGLPLLNGGAIAGYLGGAIASGLTLVQALGLTPYL